MRASASLRSAVLLLCSFAIAGCGSSDDTAQTGAAGAGGAGGTGGDAATDAGSVTIGLPQFVHGAARADTAAFPTIPIVVTTTGATPEAVELAFDGAAPIAASSDGDRFVATVDAKGLGEGSHALTVTAKAGGSILGTADATLAVASGSLQLTHFDTDGPGYADHLAYDATHDRLALSWIDVRTQKHALWLSYLDGALARLSPQDIVLNDAADEPVGAYTAFGEDAIGVVYLVNKPGDGHWLVKMRVVDLDGNEKVPAIDLTQGEAAFHDAQAGVDPNGFSAAWLHISPAADPNAPPPVEIRFARWDTKLSKLVGPITIDSDRPAATGTTAGPQTLEPLAEIGIACNDAVCLVAYTRDQYDSTVDLNVPKIFVATIDLETGALAHPPHAVEDTDWDGQQFGQSLVARDDGSFVLVYEANDTLAAVTPKSACDATLERDLFFATTFDASGNAIGDPNPIFDFEGTREYPRIAAHPAGFAMFWEDQRSECQTTGGHIGMAMNVASPDLASLLDPYLEAPGSVGLAPEYPTLATTGTNFAVSWSDDRHGLGLADPKPEVFLDTYWRK